MAEAAPGETCDVELLQSTRSAIEQCLRLGMLDRDDLKHCWEDIGVFIEGNKPGDDPNQCRSVPSSRGGAFSTKCANCFCRREISRTDSDQWCEPREMALTL